MNTAPLMGHAAGPFSLEFQLNDGSGLADANNTATLTNFNFGAPASLAPAIVTGGASGSAADTIALTNSAFFNQLIQEFRPGPTLAFRLALTTNGDAGGTPDEFTFAILDRTGAEIPTMSPLDVLMLIDIDSANPAVQTFGTDVTRIPAGVGRGSTSRRRN